MNCANHPDASAVAYCRTCGKPLCSACAKDVRGVVYCEDCLAAHLSGVMPPPGAVVPPAERPPGTPSPTLAAVLGFIPGVGAMYNGEYLKAFVYVGIFAALVALTAHGYWPFAFGIAAWVVYMPIEAYQVAKAKVMGLPVPDPFGLNNLLASSSSPNRATASAANAPGDAPTAVPVPPQDDVVKRGPLSSGVPVGAFILIGLGVLFLLGEMDLLRIDWVFERLWPLILIAIGVRVLMQRQRRGW